MYHEHKQVTWASNKLKAEKEGLLLSYIKPTNCKNVLDKRQ